MLLYHTSDNISKISLSNEECSIWGDIICVAGVSR